MNKTFRSVWNASKQTYVAAAETVRGCGRPCSTATAIAAAASLIAGMPSAHAQAGPPAPTALPNGGQVSAGQASISTNGAGMLIQQGSDRASINWQTFNVGRDAQVTFQQPGANSVTLNRVLSADPSQILGRITANGQVILTNPSGVYFGKDARVDVGGLVATTHALSDADFMAGVNRYERNGSTAGVVNDGTLAASLGGYIALLAPEVRNQGTVVAQMGTVALAAGEAVDLRFDSQHRLTSLRVEAGDLATLIENRHAVQAPGGLVILSAQSLERLQGGVVRNLGQLEATGLQQGPGGRIVLSAGNVQHAGGIDASSQGGMGGQVSLQGEHIALQGGSRIDASGATGGGTVNIGGGWQGAVDPLLQATLQPTQAATTVHMADKARIDASATTHGDGGTVVLWSDLARAGGLTTALGSVRVRGGSEGGNGGQVETSGHEVAIDGFHVDALAPLGQAGDWLIDPYNYTIGSAQAATIATALNTASVTVTTSSSNTSYGSSGNAADSGDITVTAPITKTGAADTTLTLQAARHIVVNNGAHITATGSGKLNLQLTADTALNGTGIVQLNANIATRGGTLKFGNNQSITIGGAATLVGGDVFFNGSSAQSINTLGGQLDAFGEILISNTTGLSIDTGAGNANFHGVLNSSNAYNFVNKTASNGSGSWDAARTEAKGGTGGGSAVGATYLVNITSRLENAVAGLASGYVGAWIGAYRPDSNNYSWNWADGPEAGQAFFTQASGGSGSAVGGAYSNFGAGEPNGGLNATRANTETVGQFFGTAGQWNDLTHATTYSASMTTVYRVLGYVRETNLAASPLSITSTGNVNFMKAVGTAKTLANLAVTGNQVTFNGALRLDPTGATITHSGNGQIVGVVSGTGALTKAGAGTLTLNANGSYTGATNINAGTLVLLNNAPTKASSGFNGPGALRIEPASASFSSAFSTSGWSFAPTLSGLTVGRAGNTANVTLASATTIGGPVEIHGGNIALNGALTATGGNAITLKASGTVTQAAALAADQLLLLGGNVTLTNSGNAIGTLAANGVGNLTYTDANALTLGTVGSTNGVSASGTVSIGTQTGDLTVAKDVATTNATASALVLNADIAQAAGNAAGGNLIFSGAPAVSVGAGGTARLYSGSIASSTGLTALVGSGSGRFRYNSDEAATNFTTALTPGLNAIYRERPSATVSVDSKAMTYGDNLPFLTGNTSTLVNGDTPRYAVAPAAGQKSSSGNFKAGSHTLVEDALAGLGYQLSASSGTLSVAQRAASLTGVLVADKTYDKTLGATVSSFGSISGKLTGDVVTLNIVGATASFDGNANAGTNKAVTVSGLALAGTDAANYSIGNVSATATIQPRTLTLAASSGSKVYDGTLASADTVIETGLAGSDTVTGLSQSFQSKNVMGSGGSLLVVNGGYTVNDGNSGNNYRVTLQTAAGTITPKALTITGLGSADKVYDGNTIAAVTGTAALAGSIAAGSGSSADGKPYSGDTLGLGGTASGAFNSKNVAGASTVNFSGLRLTGNDAGNYTLTPHTSAAHVITPAPLTVRANQDAKLLTEVDGSGYAGAVYSGFVGGETQDTPGVLGGSFTITRSNAGVEGANVYSGVLTPGGLTAANYTISYANGDYSILPANELLLRAGPFNSAYGSTAAYTVTHARYLDADGVTIIDLFNPLYGHVSQVGNDVEINDAYGGGTTNLTLVAQGASLSGANQLRVGSYQLAATGFTGGLNFSNLTVVGAHQVNAAGLTASAGSGISKGYDGTTAMTGLTMSLGGKEAADTVTVDGNGAFATRHAGTGDRSYTVTDLKLSGADAGNYFLTQGDSFSGSNGTITPRTLNVVYGGVDKVYNGSTAAVVTASDDRIVGDSLTVNRTALFDDKHVGNGKPVAVSGVSLTGSEAGNYTVAGTGSTSASITPAALVISGIVGAEKTYDNTTTAALDTSNLQKNGLFGSDVVNVSVSGSFADVNAGFGKGVTLSSSYGGADAGNYIITSQAGTTATILRRQVAVTASGVSKTYDGTTDMSSVTIGLGAVGGVPASGVIGGDTVTVTGVGSFSAAGAGSGLSYTLDGLALSGISAVNYVLAGGATSVAGNDGVILPKALTLDGLLAASRAYDGSITASLLDGGRLSGIVGADAVSFTSGSALFADGNVGTGKTVTLGGITLNGAEAGNYTIAGSAITTADITPKTLTITGLAASTKVYDGDTSATITDWGSVATGVGAESLTLSHGGASFSDRNVGGGKTVTATSYALADGVGGLASNYQLSSSNATTTADITTKAITVTGMTAQDRAYDATTTVTLSGGTLMGLVSGDNVAFASQTGSFADANAGLGKAVTVSGLILTGTDAGNYDISQPTGITGNITPKVVSIAGLSATNKVYDATTTATIADWGSVSTGVGSETLGLNYGAASFADKNVGTGKTVTATGYTLTDGSGLASNYQLASSSATTTASITARAITLAGVGAEDKVYDGGTAASLIGGILSGLVSGDTVGFSGGTGSFADKNAGADKAVTVSGLSLTGADAGNYAITQPTGLTASIMAKAITLAGVSAEDKVYDGGTVATLNGGSLSGVVTGDTVGFSGATGSFADKNAGTGKVVNVANLNLTGTDAGNYVLTQPAGLTASITARAITLAGISAEDKVYDGGTAASLIGGILSGLVSGDTVGFSGGTGSFADKKAGADKAVTVSGLSLTGADAGNYAITQPTGLTASITAKAITLAGVSAEDKVYDGGTAASLIGGILSGLVGGDTVGFSSGTGSFADKNAGADKAVTVSGLSLTGADAGNYAITQPTGLTASITAKAITVAGVSAEDKVYDGGTAASLVGGVLSGLVSGDTVGFSGGTGSFADKKAGADKAVTVSGLLLTGADAGNYAITQPTGLTASIMAKAITVAGIGAADKVYDGSTTATLTGGSLSGVVAGDAVGFSGATGSFADKHAGAGKAVTVAGLALSGADAANYAVSQPTGLTASIQRRDVTVTADAQQKQAQQPDPTLTYQVEALNGQRGLLAGDSLTGALTRAPGETTGVYEIQQGTVNAGGNPNYAVNYVPGVLTIAGGDTGGTPVVPPPPAPPAPVLPPEAAPLPPAAAPAALSGNAGAVGLAPSDSGASAGPVGSGITVVLTTPPTGQQSGAVSVSVPKDMAVSGAGFSFPLPGPLAEAASAAGGAVTVTTLAGGALPGWLLFNPQSLVFTASAVPDGAFPMQILVMINGQRVVITISERETSST